MGKITLNEETFIDLLDKSFNMGKHDCWKGAFDEEKEEWLEKIKTGKLV